MMTQTASLLTTPVVLVMQALAITMAALVIQASAVMITALVIQDLVTTVVLATTTPLLTIAVLVIPTAALAVILVATTTISNRFVLTYNKERLCALCLDYIYFRISIVTFNTPVRGLPIALNAELDKSIIRPRIKGPRSLILTITLL